MLKPISVFSGIHFFNMAGDGFDLPNKTTVMNVDRGNGCSSGDKLTLLLHKGVVESATYHHKKAVYAALMIPFKGHYYVDPADHIDLTAVPLWLGV